MRLRFMVGFMAILAGCADELRPQGSDAGDAAAGPRVQTRADGDARVTTVDATRDGVWVYLDLDRGERAGESMEGWDVAFQRFKVMTNGGVSGDGGVEVAEVVGARFEDVRDVPTSGWVRDAADGADENTDPDYAFAQGDGWYRYDVSNHTLAPREVVYVVRTTEGRALKLQFTGYYDRAGTSGYPAFRWAELATRGGR